VPVHTLASDCLQLLDDRDSVILVPDDEDMPILVRELPGRVSLRRWEQSIVTGDQRV
jgi:hypothetical protein